MHRKKAVARKISSYKLFSTVEARDRFDELFCNQVFLPDKGFQLGSTNEREMLPTIRAQIAALHWEAFCDIRQKLDDSVVREFYANLCSSTQL